MTFLVGAGFSVTAGLPTTAHLVRCLRSFSKRADGTWAAILDETLEQDDGLPSDVAEYSRLMAEVLSLPVARRDFISACVRWAASRQAPVSEESILLAAMLCGGTYGGVPLTTSIRLGMDEVAPLATCFARHVFTTNFDEVLPLAFHLTGRPVETVDEGSLRIAQPSTPFPTVVYLHGRHLHYDMRNTATELTEARRHASGGEEPLAQFRKMLRSTGLVVIGYSGGEDRVVDTIEDALGDANSLPYGLWWASYPSIDALSARARSIVVSSDRARFLEPGRDAERIMRALAHETGIQEASVLSGWLEDVGKVRTSLNIIMARAPIRLRKFHAEVQEALSTADEAAIRRLRRRWRGLAASVDELEDRSLAGDILASMNFVHFFYGDPIDAVETATRALAAYEAVGDLSACADQHEALVLALLHEEKLEEARRHAEAAIRMYGEVEDTRGLAHSHSLLSTVLAESGQLGDALCELEKAMSLHEAQGDQAEIASAHHDLGMLLQEMNELTESGAHLQRAFDLARGLGDDSDIGNYGSTLGALLAEGTRFEDAEMAYRQAVSAFDRGGFWAAAATARTALSDVYISMDRLDEAETILKQALRSGRQHGDRTIVRYSAGSLGAVYLGLDRFEDAEVAFCEATANRNPEAFDAFDVENLAVARAVLGKQAQAQDGFTDAEDLYVRGEHWVDAAHAASCLAGLLQRKEQHALAKAAMARSRRYSGKAKTASKAARSRRRSGRGS